MVQGVRDVFEIVDLDSDLGQGEGKLVLIGRGLDEGIFGESLRACLADGLTGDG